MEKLVVRHRDGSVELADGQRSVGVNPAHMTIDAAHAVPYNIYEKSCICRTRGRW